MIRHYRHVFRGTLSPFDEDWKNERHTELLKNDKSLIRMFEVLKLEEIEHCKQWPPPLIPVINLDFRQERP